MAINHQKKFYEFLQKMEGENSRFGLTEILDATGWKESTFKSYKSKGQLSDFISLASDNEYVASNTLGISFKAFEKMLSQSKNRRGVGYVCESLLAKALLQKSMDNMLLALELYNRPSLVNKLDGFTMLFCCAWEQLLKAIIIEVEGEAKIYKANGTGAKRTISLRDSLGIVFDNESKVKQNIELIAELRDKAVHLLMPEIQGPASRIFQSGILNYSSKFEEFTKVPFINSSQGGMISMVADFKVPPKSIMQNRYGDSAREIIELAEKMNAEIDSIDDMEFAIPLNVELSFTRKKEDGTQIILTKANEGAEGLKEALVVHKSVDVEHSHPHLENDAVRLVLNRLKEDFTVEKLKECLVKMRAGEPDFNRHCLQSVIYTEGWKKSNNQFHHCVERLGTHFYSDKAIKTIVDKITKNNDYLAKAKKKYTKRSK